MVEETPIDPLDEEIKDLKEKIRTTRDEIDKEDNKKYFYSVKTLADLIRSQRNG